MTASERDRWHTVEIDLEYGSPTFRCSAPVGSNCRSLPACQHTGACRENEGGHTGGCLPEDQIPVDTGACVIGVWIDNTEECGRGAITFPVETEWDDDFWVWRAIAPLRSDVPVVEP